MAAPFKVGQRVVVDLNGNKIHGWVTALRWDLTWQGAEEAGSRRRRRNYWGAVVHWDGGTASLMTLDHLKAEEGE